MPFSDFICRYNLNIRATSNIKIYEVLKTTGLDSKVGFYLRDGNFSSNYGILNPTLVGKHIGFVILRILILIRMDVLHLKKLFITKH